MSNIYVFESHTWNFSQALTVFEMLTFQILWPWKCRSGSRCTTLALLLFDGECMTSYLMTCSLMDCPTYSLMDCPTCTSVLQNHVYLSIYSVMECPTYSLMDCPTYQVTECPIYPIMDCPTNTQLWNLRHNRIMECPATSYGMSNIAIYGIPDIKL